MLKKIKQTKEVEVCDFCQDEKAHAGQIIEEVPSLKNPNVKYHFGFDCLRKHFDEIFDQYAKAIQEKK